MRKQRLEIDYEGVGTCINADIKINGKYICTISANSIKTNKKTAEIIKIISNAYKDEDSGVEDYPANEGG